MTFRFNKNSRIIFTQYDIIHYIKVKWGGNYRNPKCEITLVYERLFKFYFSMLLSLRESYVYTMNA